MGGAEVFQWVILECRVSLNQSVCTLLALAVKLILLSVYVDRLSCFIGPGDVIH